LLDQVSTGGGGPQIGGNTPSSPTDTGIFAALLGNLEGTGAETLAIPADGQGTAQEPATTLATTIPLTLPTEAATGSTPPAGASVKNTEGVQNTESPVNVATAIAASISIAALADARPSDTLNPETRQAAQQPSTAPQGQQSQSGVDEAVIAKLIAGPENPLKTATAQQANTPAGAQVAGTQSVPDLRTTPSPDDAARFTSEPVKTDESNVARQQGTSASPLTGLQSGLMRALGNPGSERADSAITANSIDTLVPARDAAIVQNYNQQMRLAGDEVRAPVKSLAVEITALARTGIKQFEIRMDPPELGRIDVRLDVKDNGSVTTRLVVERSETLDLLQRDARLLERALSDNGLKLDDGGLRMSLKGDGSAGQHAQSGAGNSGQPADQALGQADDETSTGLANKDLDVPPPPIHLVTVDGGIDIRV
jgi:flagellar hook-length control protein FliK